MLKQLLCFWLYLLYCLPLYSQTNEITITEWKRIIPGSGIPQNVIIQNANNNLDLASYRGRYYLAFRTAPSHFASKKAHLYILSTVDFQHWQYEHEIMMSSDLREPRFLVFHEKLFLYFFQGGTNPFRFQPEKIWITERKADSSWKLPSDANLDGYVPWRLKIHNGSAILSAYYGVGLYKSSHKGDLRLFKSSDGYNWTPLSEHPQVDVSGAEEGEFEFDDEGNLWATVRLDGEGAYIATAPGHDICDWQLHYTPRKYDSALMFNHGNEIYLISRRNLDGDMNKVPMWMPYWFRQKYNLIRYSITPKKTALFKLDKQSKQLLHITDFPSTGDNAFAGIAQKNDSTYIIANYSSDINGKTKSWLRGQLGKTFIYVAEMTFR